MAAATADERVTMTREVENRELQFLGGAVKQGLAKSTQEARKYLTAPITDQLSWFSTDSEERAAKLLDGVRPLLATWRDTWKKWAEAGKRSDGSPYSVKQWLEFGNNLRTQIQQATNQAGESGLAAYLDFTATNTVNQVKGAATWVGEQLPTVDQVKGALFWVKVGVGVVLVAGALGGTAYVVRSFK